METKNNSYFQFSFCLFNTTIQEIPSLDQEKTKVEPGQPQLSPGISTIHLHPQFPGSLCCSLLFVRIVSREEEDKSIFVPLILKLKK